MQNTAGDAFHQLVQCVLWAEMSLEGRRTSGWHGTLEETRFLTFIFNEPTPFHNVPVCSPASLVRQRSIATSISQPLDILFQHPRSVAALSHIFQQATHWATQLDNWYELIFELLGMRAGIYFHWVHLGRPRQWVMDVPHEEHAGLSVTCYCTVMLEWLERNAQAVFATLAEQTCTAAQCWPGCDLCEFTLWFGSQIKLSCSFMGSHLLK